MSPAKGSLNGWKKQEIPRQRKYARRVGGKAYTIFPQPGTPTDAAWALWQEHRRIGEFGTFGEAREWFERHIIGASAK